MASAEFSMPEPLADHHFDPIAHNTEAMLALDLHENGPVRTHQRLLEYISEAIGSPFFLGAMVCLVAIWVIDNQFSRQLHTPRFDPAPFPILQGLLGLGALLTTIVVLIKQNRFGKMELRRAHLELQVNLLTEQKVTKLINLIEELRRDLPMIKDRIDPQANAFQVPTDPESVLKALDDRLEN
jgi:uncharacterized membrane protein